MRYSSNKVLLLFGQVLSQVNIYFEHFLQSKIGGTFTKFLKRAMCDVVSKPVVGCSLSTKLDILPEKLL